MTPFCPYCEGRGGRWVQTARGRKWIRCACARPTAEQKRWTQRLHSIGTDPHKQLSLLGGNAVAQARQQRRRTEPPAPRRRAPQPPAQRQWEEEPGYVTLWENENRTTDKHPRYKGSGLDPDGNEIWVSAWIYPVRSGARTGQRRIRINIQPPWDPDSDPGDLPADDDGLVDPTPEDDLPF